MSSEDAQKRSEELKQIANKAFVQKNWQEALDLYTQAIELVSTNAILFANRSACHLGMESYGAAIEDAKKAVELDPSYPKGHYRLGCAYVSLGKYKEAVRAFATLCKLCPKDNTAKRRYLECKKAQRKEAFEKAIECDELKPVHETININDIRVDDSYDGPRLESAENGNVNLEFVNQLMEFYKNQKVLHIKYLYMLLFEARRMFASLPSLVDITVPEKGTVHVFGDIHGQYYDFMHALTHSGLPFEKNILLFNGDLVDRGSWSVEVMMLIVAMKVAYPNQVFISRGNHEAKGMNKVYGFEGEVKHKYNEKCFQAFLELFCCLPLAHVIQNKVFVCHGGLFSDDDVTLDDIRNIPRFREPPESGLMCELLWSDPLPHNQNGRQMSKRGVGIAFGTDVTSNFLKKNNLDLIIRSHEVRNNGYEIEQDGKLVTVFSAPNYCDQSGNKGAIIKFEEDMKPQYIVFSHVEHPPMKPMAYSNMGMFGM